MPNTYTQLHFQFVFAVQNRVSLIQKPWKDNLYQYITGIVQNQNHKMLMINGMPDHIHMVLGMRPIQSISDLLHMIKKDSSTWINKNNMVPGNFHWQEGYGAFSYSQSNFGNVIEYIKNQKEHHKKKTFRQ